MKDFLNSYRYIFFYSSLIILTWTFDACWAQMILKLKSQNKPSCRFEWWGLWRVWWLVLTDLVVRLVWKSAGLWRSHWLTPKEQFTIALNCILMMNYLYNIDPVWWKHSRVSAFYLTSDIYLRKCHICCPRTRW